MRNPLPRSRWGRAALALPFFVAVVVVLAWRGPDWSLVGDAFTIVVWEWIAAAIGLNLLSVVARSLSWQTTVRQAMPAPHPKYRYVFSAFSVGLLANAVLPGRIGELARVAVLRRRVPEREGVWPTLVGSVFAHRVFDLIPALLLIAYVLVAAEIPHWAITSLVVVGTAGAGLFAFGWATARRHHVSRLDGLGPAKKLVTFARHGLGVMRDPLGATMAIVFQCAGWLLQLLAVWVAMRAFHIDAPLPAAGLVLLLMNVATILPLWPGNFGLVQAAVALPLIQYGVAYTTGFAYGIGLQALEAAVGVGVGVVFLAREGLSLAMLRAIPDGEDDVPPARGPHGTPLREAGKRRARTRVPG